jgi:hypothetical protein
LLSPALVPSSGFKVQGSLACRSIRGVTLVAKLCGRWDLRLAIPIVHLYFCEFFLLEKPSLNDDPHSKLITKANGIVRRQRQAMAADDGRQTWDPYRIVRGTASLQTGCCAALCNNACDSHKCKPGTGIPIHRSDLPIDFVLAFRPCVSSATSFERSVGVGRGHDL